MDEELSRSKIQRTDVAVEHRALRKVVKFMGSRIIFVRGQHQLT